MSEYLHVKYINASNYYKDGEEIKIGGGNDGSTYWTPDTNGINYTSGLTGGNVGIGKDSSVNAALDISGNIKIKETIQFINSAWVENRSLGIKDWSAITSSADGTKLVATVKGGNIYVSSDSGVSWQPDTTVNFQQDWTAVTSSADGKIIVAVGTLTQIWCSANSGLTWTPTPKVSQFTGVASSHSGEKLIAIDGQTGYIFKSTNSGATWFQQGSDTNYTAWSDITSSADGTNLAATVQGGNILVSSDSGTSWQSKGTQQEWSSITSSGDGTRLAATVKGGNIWISTNSGDTWTEDVSVGSTKKWKSITSSSDGMKLAAVTRVDVNNTGGNIWFSHDSGFTWYTSTQPKKHWKSIASSHDGLKLAAVENSYTTETPTVSEGSTWTGSSGTVLPGGLFVEDIRVVTVQQPAVADATGVNNTETINLILNRLRAHGLISV
jgi:photosystem II stability/assembly factor-like uncharacterized protein